MKQKYNLNISLLFIFGISFIIWGLSLVITGYKNRQALSHMTVITADIQDNSLSGIKKGDYIKFSSINMLGNSNEYNNEVFNPIAIVDVSMHSLSDVESSYYAVNFNNSDKYYALKIRRNFDNFNDFINSNSTYTNTSNERNLHKFTYDFTSPLNTFSDNSNNNFFVVKVVKPYAGFDMFLDEFKAFAKTLSMSSNNTSTSGNSNNSGKHSDDSDDSSDTSDGSLNSLDNSSASYSDSSGDSSRDSSSANNYDNSTLQNLSISKQYMLELVDINKERQKLIAGIFILLSGIALFVFSKPSKIMTKQIIVENKAFNLIYSENSKADDNDIRVISDVAADLRSKISYYEYKYSQIKKTFKTSLIASILVSFAAIKLEFISALFIIALLCIIKTIVNLIMIFANKDTTFGMIICSIFDREPIYKTIHDLEIKLNKCDEVIRSSISKDEY